VVNEEEYHSKPGEGSHKKRQSYCVEERNLIKPAFKRFFETDHNEEECYELSKRKVINILNKGYHLGGKIICSREELMNGRVFLDTNILVYAHDLDAGMKHRVALKIVKDIWDKKTGVVSTQVLQEFYMTVTKKIGNPILPSKRGELSGLMHAGKLWKIRWRLLSGHLK